MLPYGLTDRRDHRDSENANDVKALRQASPSHLGRSNRKFSVYNHLQKGNCLRSYGQKSFSRATFV